MKVAIGSDHRGYDLKEMLKSNLERGGHSFIDMGCESRESVDYPDVALRVSKAVSSGECDRGVLICATGIGMSMAANKVRGVRASLCHDEFTARMSRRHNNANLLALGADAIGAGAASELFDTWLEEPFEGGRHERRIAKMMELEKE